MVDEGLPSGSGYRHAAKWTHASTQDKTNAAVCVSYHWQEQGLHNLPGLA